MNNQVFSVTCPYCKRRQIVEMNSQDNTKGVPIVYPISPDTIIGGLGGSSNPVSQSAATHAVSRAKMPHENIPNLSTVSPPSLFSVFNVFAYIKIVYRWIKEKEKIGWK